MSHWFHRLFNPHCSHCHDEYNEKRVCLSCETLKAQLDMVNHEKNRLLDRLLEKPQTEAPPVLKEISRPTNVPWNVRRQMLEAEDREKARLMALAPIPTEDLEKELKVVEDLREH